jgi:hypothetical protein
MFFLRDHHTGQLIRGDHHAARSEMNRLSVVSRETSFFPEDFHAMRAKKLRDQNSFRDDAVGGSLACRVNRYTRLPGRRRLNGTGLYRHRRARTGLRLADCDS